MKMKFDYSLSNYRFMNWVIDFLSYHVHKKGMNVDPWQYLQLMLQSDETNELPN